jgi:aminobenzoyl-glutamate utilization protein A
LPTRVELYNQIAQEVIELQPVLVATRREFHRYPEVGWLEYRTASRVCEELHGLGYSVRTGHSVVVDARRLGVPDDYVLEVAYEKAQETGAVLPWLEMMRGGFTGVLADLDTGRPGPCIAFRFDLDALPIKEAGDNGHRPALEGWSSTSATAMHACGHDGHISMGLALGLLVSRLAPFLCGRVRLIFQPAEEGVRGAAAMRVACEGVDRLFCLHLGLGIPTGEIVGGAINFLATSEIHAHITGRASHAAIEPEMGRSALLAAAQATLALHSLPQNGKHLVRVNVGILRGGVATNIVPPEADLYFRIRADNHATIEELDMRARQAVIASAQTYGCTADLEVTGQSGSENSHAELASLVTDLARDIVGVKLVRQHHPFGGSEDATLLMSEIHRRGGQATYIMLGSDVSAGHHSEHFDFDERSLSIGTELLARCLIHFLVVNDDQTRLTT